MCFVCCWFWCVLLGIMHSGSDDCRVVGFLGRALWLISFGVGNSLRNCGSVLLEGNLWPYLALLLSCTLVLLDMVDLSLALIISIVTG